jgi:hypothetical protein
MTHSTNKKKHHSVITKKNKNYVREKNLERYFAPYKIEVFFQQFLTNDINQKTLPNKNFTISAHIGGKNNIIQASNSINHAGTCRQANIKMMQNALLIWLDNNIDDNNEACRNTVAQLRRTFNIVNTFTDPDQCIDYLTDISDGKVSIIISGALCEDIVPFIHDITQLDTIFIFGENQSRYEQDLTNLSRSQGNFTTM